ncbi:hypothetical protein CDIK_2726 [Cucumispora dikerogammari]|nr:hypothetical protein CDIK_2726 [Cucumispora dikerogammari]
MYDTIIPLTKLLILLTTFYGQTYPKTEAVNNYTKLLIINQYFYFTQLSLLLTTIVLLISFVPPLKTKAFYIFILPNILIYELIVISIYWCLYFTAPILILGPVTMLPENYNLFADLCQHAFPLIGLFILFFEVHIEHDMYRYIMNIMMGLLYAFMLRYNKNVKGNYPYEFLDKIDDFKVMFVFIPGVVLLFSGILYCVIWARIRYSEEKPVSEVIDNNKSLSSVVKEGLSENV